MEIALGVLGWSPEVFRKATPHELFAGLEGYVASQGGETHAEKVKKRKEFKILYEAARKTDGNQSV